MKLTLFIILVIFSRILSAQYAPQADAKGTTAIYKDSSIIVSWATGYENYVLGVEVDETWQTPKKALGKAIGTSGDIVCLGRGGQITLTFDTLIVNLNGPDFVCFENALNHTFLELGWVEVSLDGINFERFPNRSFTKNSVGAFSDVDPTKINGYCSKYRQGYGTPFDLDSVSLDTIRYVRLVDIVGDGTALDSDGHVIYDPYATTGSAGIDVEAVGVIHAGSLHDGVEEISQKDFSIYPNPVKDLLYIECHSKLSEGSQDYTSVSYEIYDVMGNLLKQIELEHLTSKISLIDYSEGIYFIKIKTNRGSISKKIIVRR